MPVSLYRLTGIFQYSEREYLNCILTKWVICIIFDYMDERVKFAE